MPQNASTLLLVALMVVAFYLLILRPQKKRQQAVQQTMNSIEPGTRVLLGSGIFATVVEVGERQTVLEIAPGVQLTVLKQAIARVATAADEDEMVEVDELDEVTGDEFRDESFTDPTPTSPVEELPGQPENEPKSS